MTCAPDVTRVTRPRGLALRAAMVGAVALIAVLGWLDDRREAAAALEDFSQEQATLAASVGGQLRAQLALRERAPLESGEARDAVDARSSRASRSLDPMDSMDAIEPLLLEAARVARPGESLVLVLPPGAGSGAAGAGSASANTWRSVGGRRFDAPTLSAALDAGARTLRLDRPEAAALGLPARTAVAGLRAIDAGRFGRWGVAVVTSASRERDRQRRASLRLVLGVTLAGGLVFVFGAIALAQQRRELELSRELERAAAARARDERLVRADRVAVMGTLATGVAHEISTPLAVIASRTEQLIAKGAIDARGQRHLEVIQEQAERIAGVIRGFMALARGGAPVLTSTAPERLARAAVRLAEHRLIERGVTLRTDVAAALPELHCDRRLIEHALVNLLLNACAACPRGGHIELSAISSAASISTAASVSFVVDDDGVGIGQEAAARALEPFFTTKPLGEGAGLGLAITHEIVQAHHGTLTIAPRPSGGTRAVICLPIGARAVEPAR